MKYLFFTILLIVLTISIFIGSADINIFSIKNYEYNIIVNYRIPRVLFSAVIGGILGFSGSIYQLVLKNPLADALTTGASGVAALGAVISITLGLHSYLMPIISFFFALIGIAFIYKISSTDGHVHPISIILAGVILNIFASAIISLLKYVFDESLASIIFFLMGGIHYITWGQLGIIFSIFLILYYLVSKNSTSLDLLTLDEATATTTGINVKYLRMKSFIISTLLIALAVSFTGIIGFVGLIVPHIARDIFGSSMCYNIYYSTIFGAILLSISDTLSRIIIPSGAELPVGIITSIFGGIFFFYILNKKRQLSWF
ncbi:MAG: iron ABC transporter permease [Deferribacterota bacterium]|nr:iron ABC transporter permease [Deferribacterota bacterium]